MKRTAGRPLPLGKMTANDALSFAMILSVLSVMTMGVALNWVAAGILAFASFFYIVIYTMWLKRRTPQNIVIGGAAGAFPPMVGWAAVTGDVGIEAIILFAIIFFWTPPHFWALSLFANEDYKRAKIPMMTVVAGAKKTKIQMLAYAIILLPITILPSILGFAGWGYGVVAAILSLFFIFTSIRVLYSDDLKNARLMFGYSIFYLFALFLALMINGG
jgi:protoheme IX farnesyltransferase